MVRRDQARDAAGSSSPHVRGDGPRSMTSNQIATKFSPRAWGWSGLESRGASDSAVLPTCVGMVRTSTHRSSGLASSPHVRGDGPICNTDSRPSTLFSPRAWGWSVLIVLWRNDQDVLPTCVGMVRVSWPTDRNMTRSPHVRGDGPPAWELERTRGWFSPRAWGWSGNFFRVEWDLTVLPTCVGMVRRETAASGRGDCSPHVRGDGPTDALSRRASRAG